MSDKSDTPILNGDWTLSINNPSGMKQSTIYDCDGHIIYEVMRELSIDEAACYIHGFEYGVARGIEQGEDRVRSNLRKALGL